MSLLEEPIKCCIVKTHFLWVKWGQFTSYNCFCTTEQNLRWASTTCIRGNAEFLFPVNMKSSSQQSALRLRRGDVNAFVCIVMPCSAISKVITTNTAGLGVWHNVTLDVFSQQIHLLELWKKKVFKETCYHLVPCIKTRLLIHTIQSVCKCKILQQQIWKQQETISSLLLVGGGRRQISRVRRSNAFRSSHSICRLLNMLSSLLHTHTHTLHTWYET